MPVSNGGGKVQLHVSGLTLLSKCGIAFERRYIRGEKSAPSVSAAIGLAVDASANADLQSDIDHGELLPEEQVKDLAYDSLIREWSAVEASGEDEDEGLEFDKDKAIDRSVKMAEFHHRIVAPQVHPTHVQRSWTLDVRGLDVQLAGTIDRQRGTEWVKDLKTSAKSPVKTLADQSLQLTTYALAVMAHDGKIPRTVGLDYLVMTPRRGEQKLIQLESTRTKESFSPLLERVYQADRLIKAGVFAPAPVDSWVCSKKFCSYWTTCKFAVRPVSVAIGDVAA